MSDADPSCPFCTIASTAQPHPANPLPSPDATFPPSYVLLSTPYVIAFLDIMPMTRGHVLVTCRRHVTKISDLTSREGAELGKHLPLISRAVVRAVLDTDDPSDGDWNIVQNNGARAAQVVPHVHFHIIPRPKTDGVPTLKNVSWTMFGRGQREELDDADAQVLIRVLRSRVEEELRKAQLEEDDDRRRERL